MSDIRDASHAMLEHSSWADRLRASVPSFYCRVFCRTLVDNVFLAKQPHGNAIVFRSPKARERINTFDVYWTATCVSKHQTVFDLMKSLGLVGSSRQFMHKFVCRTDFDSARNALNTVSAANAIANHRWLCSAHEQRQLAEVFAAYAHCSVADAMQHAVLTMSDFIPIQAWLIELLHLF